MKATLDVIAVFVELNTGEIHFGISPSEPPLQATLLDSLGVSKEIEARYAHIPLASRDLLAANDELRSRVRSLGRLFPSTFWYTLGGEEGCVDLQIHDLDPSNHKTLRITCDSHPPSRYESRCRAFSAAIAASGLCERKPYWKEDELYVKLKAKYAHPAHRLDTYARLLEFF